MREMTPFTKLNLLGGIVGAMLLMPVGSALAAVTAQLEPERIGVEDAATLTITVTGDHAGRPESIRLPDGLQVGGAATSNSVSIVNGSMTRSTSWSYPVAAERPGRYRIESVRVGGADVGPFDLEVVAGSLAPTRSARGPRSLFDWDPFDSTSPMPDPFGSLGDPFGGWPGGDPFGRLFGDEAPFRRPSRPAPTLDGPRAFLGTWLPKQEIVVGETVPIVVKAWFRADTGGAIEGGPEIDAGTLAVGGLDGEAVRKSEERDGVPYTTLTWTGRVTAVRPELSDLSVKVPVRLEWDEPGAGRWGRAFGSRKSRQTELASAAIEVEVEAVPASGRPAGFGGAVGSFELSAEGAPARVRVGEPVHLQATVSGTGNLAVVDLEAPAVDGWDLFAAGSETKTENTSGTRGSKTFEWNAVPTRQDAPPLGDVSLAFYDPTAGAYREATAAFPEVDILPGPSSTVAAAAPLEATSSATPAVEADAPPPTSARAPWRAVPVHDLRAPATRSRFVSLLVGLLLLALLANLEPVRRRVRLGSERAAAWTREQVHRLRARLLLGRATDRGDVAAFLRSAEALLAAEAGLSSEALQECSPLFRRLQEARYGDRPPSPEALRDWRDDVVDELTNLRRGANR